MYSKTENRNGGNHILFDCPPQKLNKINLAGCDGKCTDNQMDKCLLRKTVISTDNLIDKVASGFLKILPDGEN